MTKQEQIEEIARLMCMNTSNSGDCEKCGFKRRVEFGFIHQCFKYDDAETIYNAGYRKEDEVRKETAKEILMKRIGNLLRIKSMFSDPLYDHRGLQDHLVAVIKIEIESVKNQAKYYGVEVEE